MGRNLAVGTEGCATESLITAVRIRTEYFDRVFVHQLKRTAYQWKLRLVGLSA